MVFCPLQYLFDLRPVGNIVKFNQTQWRTGYNQAIEVLVSEFIKVTVEVVEEFHWRVA